MREKPLIVIYVPFYLHKNNPKYCDPDEVFIQKVYGYLQMVNPSLTPEKVKDIRVFRYEYAQPVATTHFLDKLPPISSPERKGFFISDTAYCYPEDRSITESVKAARHLVEIFQKQCDESFLSPYISDEGIYRLPSV